MVDDTGTGLPRRTVLKAAGAASAALAAWPAAAAGRTEQTPPGWERSPMRWFQLAFTEDDPGRYDPRFWLKYFQEIGADGVCLSAGGGIAFYPTKVAYHGRARQLGASDPFGEMVAGSKRLGMRVLARIDPHAMNETAFAAHPEWALTGADGRPRRHPTAPDLYLTCALGPYNFEFMPQVIDEIAARYPVDGFFGNRWSGSGVCYCESCRSRYAAATGREVPANPDPAQPDGRLYARWTEGRLLELVDLWNGVIRRRRPGAFFIPGSERRGLVELDGKALGERLPLVFCDRQGRSAESNIWSTGPRVWSAGRYTKQLHAFMQDKPVGHIISVGVEEAYRWKDSVQSPAELRIWAAEAIAHGSRPWVTKFNAKPLDRRWMPVISDLYRWHRKNERYLRNTESLARVALVMSPRSSAYLGGQKQGYALDGHLRGYYQALLEARVPFDMIDEAFLEPGRLARYQLLILPNVAVMSEAQCAAIREYVAGGGGLVATHETSLFDLAGQRRDDFGLADLFGCHFDGAVDEKLQNAYLTLRQPHPALTAMIDTPRTIGPTKRVHVRPTGDAQAPLTLAPSYPDLPMERVFSNQPTSDIPMALCRGFGRGRVAFLPMDLDRTFDEIGHGDHLRLLSGFAAWAADEQAPLTVTGPGLVDVALWRQSGSIAAHLVNLNNAMTQGGSYREAVPTGPYRVEIALPRGARVTGVRLLEADRQVDGVVADGRLSVHVPQIAMHEVVAVDLA